MSENDKIGTAEQMKLLIQRYGQLRELVEHKNKVIYQIFYLSVIFVGVVIGGYRTLQPVNALSWFALFTSIVFISMLLWTRTYIHSRSEIHRLIDTVYDEIEALEVTISNKQGEELFRRRPKKDETHSELWEKQAIKNNLLQIYYITLSTIPIFYLLFK